MPEIKNTFSGGKMNKDLDERLVQNGEYRHAMNVQVRTTSGDTGGVGDAGVVQNIQGNSEVGASYLQTPFSPIISNPNEHAIVGSIANEKTNKSYFFVAGLRMRDLDVTTITAKRLFLDTIMEVTVGTTVTTTVSNPVVVDKYGMVDVKDNLFSNAMISQNAAFMGPGNYSNRISFIDTSDLRVGMKLILIDIYGQNLWQGGAEPVISEIKTAQQVQLSSSVSLSTTFSNVYAAIFEAPRVLNFENDKKITAINIIDNLLFWTDGATEPKKINIRRCLEGTTSITSHTQLKLSDPYDDNELLNYVDIDGDDSDNLELSLSPEVNNDLKEEHITVKREAPRMAPTLKMRDTLRSGETSCTIDLSGTVNATTMGSDGGLLQQGDTIIMSTTITGENPAYPTVALNPMWGLDWQLNDVLTFTEDTGPYAPTFTVSIDPGTNLLGGNPILAFTVLSVSDSLVQPNINIDGSGIWNITLQEEKPLFETKFGRFGLRYKYEDGEYSSFGPWSELAFLPARFKYDHRKGYNLGMVNNVRELIIKDFIPHQRVKPYDVTAVDILYKTTDSPNVYVVKTITRGVDPEWDMYYPSAMNDEMQFGEFKIKSELIHNAVDKNQILRSWDNVPRFALAQELAANRLIYANYTQGYNIKDSVGLHQNHIAENWLSNSLEPIKSVKSIRDYKFGMVFGDKYGRETPVISPGLLSNNISLGTGDVRIDKQFSSYRNRFEVQQVWNNAINSGVPEDWMEYVKYFVKETSNEYYNLIMDRWYDAEDGNIWLSFNSADRNKIDEETYLVLKNEHGNNTPVIERARYRIIAIESEAPEFIRLDPRQMGQRQIGGSDLSGLWEIGTYDADQDSPTRLMGYDRELTLTSASGWNNMMGGHLVLGHAKGTVKIRINAQNGFGTLLKGSMWNTLTYISQNSDGDEGTFRWKEPFLETVDFIDRFTAAGETISGLRYFIEFREFAPENKPEYDGKFFVKVERDAVLDNRVLKYEEGSSDWDSIGVHYLSYIDPRGYHPASNGVNGTGPDRGGYEWMTSSGGNSVGASGIDGANLNDGTFVSPTFQPGLDGTNSSAFISGFGLGDWDSGGDGWADQTKSFWKQAISVGHARIWAKIFVDAAPARVFKIFGSDCGNRVDLDSNNNATGGIGDGVDPFVAYKPTGFDAGRLSYSTGADIVNPTPANEFGRLAMSLLPHMAASSSPDGSPYGSQDWSVQLEPELNWKETEFFQAMATPGQYFRFSYDNTGIDHLGNVSGQLYKVVSRGGGPFSNNVGGDIDWWGFPNGYNQTMHVMNYSSDSWSGSDNQCGGPTSSPSVFAYTDNWMINGALQSYTPPIHGDNLWDFWESQSGSVGNFMSNFNGSTHWGPGGTDCRDAFYNNAQDHIEIMYGGIEVYDSSSFVGSIGNGCPPNWENDPYGGREGMRVEFRRCNPDGTLMSGPNGAGSVGIDPSIFDPRATSCHDGREGGIHIRLWKRAQVDPEKKMTVADAAVFETEPKEDVGLDIYYEASNAIPMYLTPSNAIDFAPYNSEVLLKSVINADYITLPTNYENYHVGLVGYMGEYPVIGIKNNITNMNTTGYMAQNGYFNLNQHIVFRHPDGTETMAKIVQYAAPTNESGTEQSPISGISQLQWDVDPISEPPFVASTQGKTGFYAVDPQVYNNPVVLGWFNCYSFGNGVESDRIRDDYNAMMIDNGVKVSSTFLGYGQEEKGSGLIYSGIYNSISGVNSLNEFNMAEKITKDLNPIYGTIQRLKTRDTSLVTFCEDKILQITTNKDALYNADGDAKLIATNRVLGTAVPFAGDYGISKNPESLAWDQFRYYFSDTQRGAVLRLSMDGITPISSVGMKTWFRDNLPKTKQIIGTFDTVNDEYNITLKYKYSQNKVDETVSFSEDSQGWVSFKSFIPESGGSVGGKYLTAVKNKMWLHYVDIKDSNTMSNNFGNVINRNTFYPEAPYTITGMNSYFTPSELTVMFNDAPGSVKTFQSLSYEGSQARVEIFTDGQDGGQLYQPDGAVYTPPYGGYYQSDIEGITGSYGDGEYYNLQAKDGWWVESIRTDLSFNGAIKEFKDKEGKWYNSINSVERGEIQDGHLEEFSVQGLGVIQATDTEPTSNPNVSITLTGDNINNPQNPAGLGNPDNEDTEDE